MLHHFSILFFIYKSKVNRKGEMPIFCRVTLDGVRKQFATGNHVQEAQWNNRVQLKTAYSEILKEKETFFIDDIYNRFTGSDKEHQTLLQAFEYHNKK